MPSPGGVRRGPARDAEPAGSHLPVGVDDGLAVGIRLLEPVLGQLSADLLQAVLELRSRRHDLHALRLELLDVPFGLLRRDLPTPLLSRSCGFQKSVLLWLAQL